MLSQLPSPESFVSIGWAVVITFCIVGGINQVMRLVDRFRPEKPEPQLPPNNLLGADHSHLTRRVDGHEEDIAELRREIKQNQAEQARTDSIHRSSLYRKIDDTRAELETKMESHRRELSQDIKDMPAQVIALLKNTDAI